MLRETESSQVIALAAADAAAGKAQADYLGAAKALTAGRRAAGDRLAKAVQAELAPLKLDKARFRVAVDPLAEDRVGPAGADRVEFEVSTNPGAPFGGLGVIASGGELARFALALKAALAGRADQAQPLMIFDEVDQGVGGAVADAVGLRLKRLAGQAQVLVVTHSPQVAARADAHWRVVKAGEGERVRTAVEALSPTAREEEIARMLSGAEITEAARAAGEGADRMRLSTSPRIPAEGETHRYFPALARRSVTRLPADRAAIGSISNKKAWVPAFAGMSGN